MISQSSKKKNFGLGVIIVLGVVSILWCHEHSLTVFINHWGYLFKKYKTPDVFKHIGDPDRPDLIHVVYFANSEWVAARTAYSCTDGADFNATVFLDSKVK